MTIEKNYRYYKIPGDVVKALEDEYGDTGDKIDAVYADAVRSVGAKHALKSRGWGAADAQICGFAFHDTHEFPCEVRILKRFDDNLISVRGKGKSQPTREFNKKLQEAITAANEQLKGQYAFKDFVIQHFKVWVCTTGDTHPSGRGGCPYSKHGPAMLSGATTFLYSLSPKFSPARWVKSPRSRPALRKSRTGNSTTWLTAPSNRRTKPYGV